jgi:hypothetical protein
MSAILASLLDRFQVDEWRNGNGFSPEIDDIHKVLFGERATREEQLKAINGWIQKYQPCLFGRVAAAHGAIRYCLISETDIRAGDEVVLQRIRDEHLRWTRDTFEGRSSNFVILVISERVASALPNNDVLKFAKKLAGFYLQEDEIEADHIYHDAAFLAIPDQRERVLKWKAGVNYFAAHGDKRWWQDHRIPGGLGFSTNSVGHLAKSGKLLATLDKYLAEIGMSSEERSGPKIDSLATALKVAMQTIDNASNALSGRATELLPLPSDPTALPLQECPVKLPPKLETKNFCYYRGYYHTDFTLPSEYFRSDVERPPEIKGFEDLDFTYLFHASPDNVAHETMGEGVAIRSDFASSVQAKYERMVPGEVSVADEPSLLHALKG